MGTEVEIDMNALRVDEALQLKINEYVKRMELAPTLDVCKCTWVEPLPGKKLKTDVNMLCPVHTREGLIYWFVRHEFPNTLVVLDGFPYNVEAETSDGQSSSSS